MSELPALLAEAIGDSRVLARVDLGGGDTVVVTPGATHIYRSEGLLSDETVDSHDHETERFVVETGRRKAALRLLDAGGERSFKVPASAADEVVEAVLEGVLRTAGALDDDETVEAAFRFSELTLVVTDRRLLKHVGGAVWDEEFEAVAYEALTDLDFEEGSVATQVVVQTDDRRERVKVPNEHAARVRNAIRSAVFAFHDVSSPEELREKIRPEEPEESADEAAADVEDDTDDGFVPAPSSPPADQDVNGPRGVYRSETDSADENPADAGSFGVGSSDDDLADEIAALNDRLDRQADLLESHRRTIEQLVEELRRGR